MLLGLLLVGRVYAAEPLTFVPSLPSQVETETEYQMQTSFAGNLRYYDPGKTYFLRGVFYPLSRDKNYFGETKNNGGEWIGTSSDKSKYYSITLDENASWSGTISVRVPLDAGVSNQPYGFKIGRYSSSAGSATWTETIQEVSIKVPPTPTPTPEPTPTQTPAPTPAPTPLPTPPPTPTPTPSLKPSPTIYIEEWEDIGTESASVAGIMDEEVVEPEAGSLPVETPSKMAPVMITLGSLLALGGIVPYGWKYIQSLDG